MKQTFSFDTINRIYDERRLSNRRVLMERRARVYEAVPEYESLDTSDSVTSKIDVNRIVSGDIKYSDGIKQDICNLAERRKRLLKENGFAEDYLEPVYTCMDCKDTGYIGNNRCHCYKKELLRLMYKQSNLDKLIEIENFDTFNIEYYPDNYILSDSDITPRDNIKEILNYCRGYIDNFASEHGNILIYGNSGVGKTFLSNCIAKEILDAGYSVIYLTSHQLFDILETKVFHHNEMDDMSKGVISMLYTCDLLIIDDLGTEMINSFTESQLFTCIQDRLLAKVGTIISTNFSFDDISRHYSERIFSRLIGNYKLIKIAGEDIRIKKALN